MRARQRDPLVEYLENRSRRAAVRLPKRAIAAAIARADTCILKRYLFLVVDWIICLPRAGRPGGDPATFTIQIKGIQT